MQDKTDTQLYDMLRKGSPDADRAFAALYARFSQRVYMYTLKVTGNRSDAQDIFQESFIRLHQAAAKGYEVRNVLSYLLKIARNLCFNLFRDEKPLASLDNINVPVRETSYESRELLRLIDTALDCLEVEYRDVFTLKEYQGLTYAEIAEITGDSVPAIKSRVWRAKEKIRKVLTPYLADLEKF